MYSQRLRVCALHIVVVSGELCWVRIGAVAVLGAAVGEMLHLRRHAAMPGARTLTTRNVRTHVEIRTLCAPLSVSVKLECFRCNDWPIVYDGVYNVFLRCSDNLDDYHQYAKEHD